MSLINWILKLKAVATKTWIWCTWNVLILSFVLMWIFYSITHGALRILFLSELVMFAFENIQLLITVANYRVLSYTRG